jgi:hypothetical protein
MIHRIKDGGKNLRPFCLTSSDKCASSVPQNAHYEDACYEYRPGVSPRADLKNINS